MDSTGFLNLVGTDTLFFPLVDISGSQEGEKKDLSNVGVNMQASKEVLIFFLSLLRNALSIFCFQLVWSKSSP